MRLLLFFGIGCQRIIVQNHSAAGTVTKVQKCWWIKVNTKPIRTHALDGALFPHVIHYRYTVNGQDYAGKRFVGVFHTCPPNGRPINVYYDPAAPIRSAVLL